MKSGPLRHRVLLQTAVDTTNDDTGAPARTWTDIGYWHCTVEPLSTRESLISGGVMDEMDTKLTGHYFAHVAGMRAKDRAIAEDGVRIYNLAGVPRVSNDRSQIELRVKSGLSEG